MHVNAFNDMRLVTFLLVRQRNNYIKISSVKHKKTENCSIYISTFKAIGNINYGQREILTLYLLIDLPEQFTFNRWYELKLNQCLPIPSNISKN